MRCIDKLFHIYYDVIKRRRGGNTMANIQVRVNDELKSKADMLFTSIADFK